MQINDYVLASIKKSRPGVVVLHANWSMYRSIAVGSALRGTIEMISKLSPKTKVAVLGGVPQWSPTLPVVLARAGAHKDLTFLPTDFFVQSRATEAELSAAARARNVLFVSAEKLLCSGERCAAAVVREGGLVPTAWDYGHLTREGAELLVDALAPRLREL